MTVALGSDFQGATDGDGMGGGGDSYAWTDEDQSF